MSESQEPEPGVAPRQTAAERLRETREPNVLPAEAALAEESARGDRDS